MMKQEQEAAVLVSAAKVLRDKAGKLDYEAVELREQAVALEDRARDIAAGRL